MRALAYLEYISNCVAELDELRLFVMFGGEDWRESTVGGGGIGKPTESAALWRLGVEPSIANAERRIARLEAEIGECLVLLRGVRIRYGSLYSDVLELRFVDRRSWRFIAEELEMATTTARRCCEFAVKRIDLDGIGTLKRISNRGLDGGTPKR